MRWLAWTVLALCLGACKRDHVQKDVPLLPVITEQTTDVLFTWIDEKGEFHTEQKASDVPESARETVRIADPVKDPPQLDDVFVADLRSKDAQGHFAVKTMSRATFESLAVERRKKTGNVLSPKAAESAPPEAARPAVIIYGASWCGPCHQAAAYLKRRGIAFVEKDIESDSGAAREMHTKLQQAGMRGGSIPVIDVLGKIMVGFDESSVERALKQGQKR